MALGLASVVLSGTAFSMAVAFFFLEMRHERRWSMWTGVAFAVRGVAHHAGNPPRNHMGGAQIGLGEHRGDRAVVLNGAEIHLPHQTAQDPRAVQPGALVGRIEGKAGHR